METKLSIFIDNLHEHEYIRTEKEKFYVHQLFYSHSEHWTEDCKGKLIFEIKENKEDSKLSFPSVSSFSICEAEYFDILLRIILREENMSRIIEVSKRELL